MAKKPKQHKPASRHALNLREWVAENVSLLLPRAYPPSKYSSISDQEKALAKESGVSWSTVQRVLHPKKATEGRRRRSLEDQDVEKGQGARIDTIADIAAALGVQPADLLIKNFAYRLVTPNSDEPTSCNGNGHADELQ